MKIGSKVYAEIYHPEELEYRKIWAECKVVKKQFFNNLRKNATQAFVQNMEFNLTEEQKLLIKTTKSFVKNELLPHEE